jgi:hypothetical protein
MAELKAELRKRLEANCAGSCPPRLRGQDHRVRHGQRHGRAAGRADRPGSRGHARRAAIRAGPPGHGEEAYLKVVGKTDEEIHAEFRPQAEKRVKTLLVLSEIAKARRTSRSRTADVQGEIERARSRYANNPNLIRYFESERGRNYIRSTFRRSRTVEMLVDEWLAAHPESPRLPHIEDSTKLAGSHPSGEAAARSARPIRAALLRKTAASTGA